MNKIKYNSLVLLIALFFTAPLSAQHISDLRLNEMLINNVDNYIDEYGRHVPWIEIFNPAYNTLNVGECYLTNDTTGLHDGSGLNRWYRIPKGDPKTILPQRSFVVFYMDNAPLYGTFHVNFDPREEGSSNYVALISSNGRTLIDIFEYPDSLRRSTAHSYGYFDDGVKEIEDEHGKLTSNKGFLEYFTPGSTNKVFEGLTKSEQIALLDPHGWKLAMIAMAVVFLALITIYLMLKVFAKLNKRKTLMPAKAATGTDTISTGSKDEVSHEGLTSEELAAISMALHLHLTNMHDVESEIITIETPSAHYSPWAQKHLVLNKVSRKK